MDIDYSSPSSAPARRVAVIAGWLGVSIGVAACVGTGVRTFCRYWWLPPGPNVADLGEAFLMIMIWLLVLAVGVACAGITIAFGWRSLRNWVRAIITIVLCASPLVIHDLIWSWIVHAHGLWFHE